MSKAKQERLELQPGMYVTCTSRLSDKKGVKVPRGRVVFASKKCAEPLVRNGKLRAATEHDVARSKEFYHTPVGLAE